uniref:Uncharacterized protein n=1 Tax=Aegilops tauschii TaxID=37682 RepID=M8CD22_AEGTA
MAKHTTLLLVAIVAVLLTATAATLAKAPSPTTNKPTAYEMLGTRVARNIKNETISGLEGIKVKAFIAWIGIREVGRDGDELRLHAGMISKSFPVGDISSSPKCN